MRVFKNRASPNPFVSKIIMLHTLLQNTYLDIVLTFHITIYMERNRERVCLFILYSLWGK